MWNTTQINMIRNFKRFHYVILAICIYINKNKVPSKGVIWTHPTNNSPKQEKYWS